jgi:hypothetical protein
MDDLREHVQKSGQDDDCHFHALVQAAASLVFHSHAVLASRTLQEDDLTKKHGFMLLMYILT